MAGTNVETKDQSSYRGTSLEAIRHQYDFLGEFYRLTLGEDLVYSYGMWEDGDTLESAQRRKLDYHAEAAGAVGAARVLDVGCGWGSLMRRLVDKHEAGHVVGLTMSPAQTAWIREQGWPRCEAREENWFDHVPEAPYDAVIAIEAIEHFAGTTLRRAQRIASYRAFFQKCHSWMRPGGLLSLQTNAWNGPGWLSSLMMPVPAPDEMQTAGESPTRRPGPRDIYHGVKNLAAGMHASRNVFPEVFLPTRSELTEASRGLFRLSSERSDPKDGVLTLQNWLERGEANRARGNEIIGEKSVSDVFREQSTALRFMRERRYTVLRLTFEKE
ncbi:SAM-dependent methyltransferase [Streptomyces iconiensis]|uniref:Class I SAM-dependent methyltransferase n=1 Tax=Streptomyces iconiensis TaxID=1384038 RepID=A0ABT6ZWG6_9ACTN|nr:class I SAM-dependent methyltransferase [Streptomyces iconiensis]MDJ1132971.1 class I SAM-dependent methyltransferase [Streptomyces iconiensis]